MSELMIKAVSVDRCFGFHPYFTHQLEANTSLGFGTSFHPLSDSERCPVTDQTGSFCWDGDGCWWIFWCFSLTICSLMFGFPTFSRISAATNERSHSREADLFPTNQGCCGSLRRPTLMGRVQIIAGICDPAVDGFDQTRHSFL